MAIFFSFGDTEVETGEKGGGGGYCGRTAFQVGKPPPSRPGGRRRDFGLWPGRGWDEWWAPAGKKGRMKEIPVFGGGPTHSPLWGGREELG